MWIENLESRRLLSAAVLGTSPAQASDAPAIRAAFHTKAAATLTRNIVGTYGGSYSRGNTPFAGSGAMTIATQTTSNFTGTMSIDDGPALPFNAKLSHFKGNGSQGAGYYFTFNTKSGTTKLHFKGAFQNGANGFHVQFNGTLNGTKVSAKKPHSEFVLRPDDPSTFLR